MTWWHNDVKVTRRFCSLFSLYDWYFVGSVSLFLKFWWFQTIRICTRGLSADWERRCVVLLWILREYGGDCLVYSLKINLQKSLNVKSGRHRLKLLKSKMLDKSSLKWPVVFLDFDTMDWMLCFVGHIFVCIRWCWWCLSLFVLQSQHLSQRLNSLGAINLTDKKEAPKKEIKLEGSLKEILIQTIQVFVSVRFQSQEKCLVLVVN